MKVKIGENIIRTIALALVWVFAAVLWMQSTYPYQATPVILLLAGLIFAVPTFITYTLLRASNRDGLMEGMQNSRTENGNRSQRVQHWLESLDDDELDALRDRLQEDVPERSLEALLSKPKRR